MLVTPQKIERARAASVEHGDIDEIARGTRERGALVGCEVAARHRERMEARGFDHGRILDHARDRVQN